MRSILIAVALLFLTSPDLLRAQQSRIGDAVSLDPFVPAAHPQITKIEIFVTSWCPYCKALERFLQANELNYIRYDIEQDPQAKAIHDRYGSGVPVTIINGKTVLQGFDKFALSEALGISTAPGSIIKS